MRGLSVNPKERCSSCPMSDFYPYQGTTNTWTLPRTGANATAGATRSNLVATKRSSSSKWNTTQPVLWTSSSFQPQPSLPKTLLWWGQGSAETRARDLVSADSMGSTQLLSIHLTKDSDQTRSPTGEPPTSSGCWVSPCSHPSWGAQKVLGGKNNIYI